MIYALVQNKLTSSSDFQLNLGVTYGVYDWPKVHLNRLFSIRLGLPVMVTQSCFECSSASQEQLWQDARSCRDFSYGFDWELVHSMISCAASSSNIGPRRREVAATCSRYSESRCRDRRNPTSSKFVRYPTLQIRPQGSGKVRAEVRQFPH